VRLGRAVDHSPPSSAGVMEEYSYTSTHTGPLMWLLYLYICMCVCVCMVVCSYVTLLRSNSAYDRCFCGGFYMVYMEYILKIHNINVSFV